MKIDESINKEREIKEKNQENENKCFLSFLSLHQKRNKERKKRLKNPRRICQTFKISLQVQHFSYKRL